MERTPGGYMDISQNDTDAGFLAYVEDHIEEFTVLLSLPV
jgi:hypothetical protein